VLGILGYPAAAVLGETAFEVVAGALGDPERRPVAGMDLQPDPGNGEAAVGPHKVVADTAREAMPRPLLGSYPIGEFDTSGVIGH
jgi:hypothetical protein